MMKTCSQCQKEQPESAFHRDWKSSDALASNCKACKRLAAGVTERTKKPLPPMDVSMWAEVFSTLWEDKGGQSITFTSGDVESTKELLRDMNEPPVVGVKAKLQAKRRTEQREELFKLADAITHLRMKAVHNSVLREQLNSCPITDLSGLDAYAMETLTDIIDQHSTEELKAKHPTTPLSTLKDRMNREVEFNDEYSY